MDKKTTAKHLNELIQLDIDAVYAYNQAIEEIEHREIRNRLTQFRQDHERHINDLSGAVLELQEKPIEHKRDLKGFLLEGFTAIRSKTGTEGALKAMLRNEQMTNKKYADVRTGDFTGAPKAMVDRGYEDERRHLDYIQGALETRVWEK